VQEPALTDYCNEYYVFVPLSSLDLIKLTRSTTLVEACLSPLSVGLGDAGLQGPEAGGADGME
jgi:hypothetical protein